VSGDEGAAVGSSVAPAEAGPAPAAQREFLADLLAGLRARPRSIPSKYFYDERGSALFEEICALPEYYVTRTELAILRESAAEIAELLGPCCLLIEYGSGSSAKVRLLLDRLEAPAGYVPIDVSAEHLHALAAAIARDYQVLAVAPLVADFTRRPTLPPHAADARRVVTFPGSTIGNLPPEEARELLVGIAELVGRGGAALIGVDLAKPRAILEPAYDDAAGVTAEFNRNVLWHANRVLGADFEPKCYAHRALYNEAEGRVEMHLEAMREQVVTVAGERFVIEAGERIRTEYSYKYTVPQFSSLARSAGLTVARTWTDAAGLFSVQYLVHNPG
jgi:L-histidine N-alpha-methyltransferase